MYKREIITPCEPHIDPTDSLVNVQIVISVCLWCYALQITNPIRLFVVLCLAEERQDLNTRRPVPTWTTSFSWFCWRYKMRRPVRLPMAVGTAFGWVCWIKKLCSAGRLPMALGTAVAAEGRIRNGPRTPSQASLQKAASVCPPILCNLELYKLRAMR